MFQLKRRFIDTSIDAHGELNIQVEDLMIQAMSFKIFVLGISPVGTMAHEFLQAFQALNVRLRNFQVAALENWVHGYRGDLTGYCAHRCGGHGCLFTRF